MVLQKCWEIQYTCIHSTATKKDTVRGECLTDAPTLIEAVQKFNKLNPGKRGTSYEIDSIQSFTIGLLK